MQQPNTVTRQYPAGARLRVKQICSDKKRSTPGLLPICDGTFWKWVKQGKVGPGIKLGSRTRVWPIEEILALAGEVEKV